MSTPVQPESNFAVDGTPIDSDQFRLLVDNVSDYAIFGLDPSGNITSWNLGAEKIKGYAAHEKGTFENIANPANQVSRVTINWSNTTINGQPAK